MRLRRIAGRVVQAALAPLGLELRRKEEPTAARASLRGSLQHAQRLGFRPRTVIDVGAADGTYELYETFPDAVHVLVEPLAEYEPLLRRVVQRYPKALYVGAAAGRQKGTVTINVHKDIFGSSLYLEREDSDVNGAPRVVPMTTVDDVVGDKGLSGPFLIKVDVQGAELDVLGGAARTLRDTEYVVLEVSLFPFFDGGPQLADVVAFMKEQGFVAYDLLDSQYRLLDGAMSQVDLAFVKDGGEFRKHTCYATREQRAARDAAVGAKGLAG